LFTLDREGLDPKSARLSLLAAGSRVFCAKDLTHCALPHSSKPVIPSIPRNLLSPRLPRLTLRLQKLYPAHPHLASRQLFRVRHPPGNENRWCLRVLRENGTAILTLWSFS
jgi:hypothetical protein